MNAASKTIYYFSFYLFLTGLTLIFAPNLLLGTLGFETTSEVWIKIVGSLALAIGVYYYTMSSDNNEKFNRTTTYVRFMVVGWFLLFVILGWAPVQLLGFGAIDLLGALWTWSALKNLGKN